MMWFSLARLALKTGSEVYKNRQETRLLQSQAERTAMAKMATGEIEYKAQVIEGHRGDWKDEFVLILISIPLLLLAWSVFSDDPNIQQKIDIFFDKFSNLPFWYQSLFIGVVASIYGLKGADIFKKK